MISQSLVLTPWRRRSPAGKQRLLVTRYLLTRSLTPVRLIRFSPDHFPEHRKQIKPRRAVSHISHTLSSRGPPLPKRAYEISNLPKDFKISAKISDFSRFSKISAKISEFSEDFKISRFQRRFQISRRFLQRFQDFTSFLVRFQDFSRDLMVVRGRPIARARSVVPVTQRVPECVCVKLRK